MVFSWTWAESEAAENPINTAFLDVNGRFAGRLQPKLSLGCSPSTRPNVERPTSPRRSNEARRVEEHIGDSARSELLVHLLPALGRKQTSDRGGTESWYGAARRH